jgi:uncharacterized protein involved in exopolysaccharide biosynthesis
MPIRDKLNDTEFGIDQMHNGELATMDPAANGEHSRSKDVQEIHLLDLLIILSKRRKFILCFTFGAAILTAIIVLLIPSKYTAQTILLPPAENSSLSSTLLNQLGGSSMLASIAGSSLGVKNPADMYVALFRIQPVEDALIRRFGLMARYHKKTIYDARRAFEDRSTVVLGVKDGLIRVTFTDRDPKFAAAVANGYVDEFKKLSARLAITEASQRRAFFQQQLLEANQNLASAEAAMEQTEQSTGVLQIDSQARALIQSAATLRGQIGAKQVELQAMRAYATPDNPEVVMAQQQLAALKAQLAQLGGTAANSSSDIIVPKGNMPAAQMEYVRKLRDVKYYQTIEEILAKQFEMAKLDEAREGAIIQVAQVAISPDKRSSPHRTLIVLLITLIALVVAMVWVLTVARWEQSMRDPDISRKVQNLRELFRRGQETRVTSNQIR